MDQLFCTVCGHRLGSGDLFCTACGAQVARSATAAPGTAAATPEPTRPVPVAPMEATAVRPRVEPLAAPVPGARRSRPRRSRARFWGGVAAAAVVVGAVSYGLGTLARGGGHAPTAGPTGTATTPAASGTAGPTSSPKPSVDPHAMAQARALHTLITQSATDKQRIATAADQLQRCDGLGQAIETFQDAAASRDRLVEQAAGLQVGLLPGGGAAIADLSSALRAAAAADRAYVAWGESRHQVRVRIHRQHGKGHGPGPRFREACRGGAKLKARAVRLSVASHGAKQETATAWNLVAAQFGLPTVTWTEL